MFMTGVLCTVCGAQVYFIHYLGVCLLHHSFWLLKLDSALLGHHFSTLKVILRLYIYKGLVWLIVSGVWNIYDFRWMIMLDFICIGSTELFGTGWDWKNQNENMSQAGFEQRQWNSSLDRLAMLAIYQMVYFSLKVSWYTNTNGHVAMQVWNRLCFDSQCKVL